MSKYIKIQWLPNRAGGRLNKKDGLTRYGDSHVKDKTSSLTWKLPYADKTVFILRRGPVCVLQSMHNIHSHSAPALAEFTTMSSHVESCNNEAGFHFKYNWYSYETFMYE